MSWKINGITYTGNIAEVGTGKEFASFLEVKAAYPTGDLLILAYEGSADDIVQIKPIERNMYVKAVDALPTFVFFQLLYLEYSPGISIIFEGFDFYGSGVDYRNDVNMVFSKCKLTFPYRIFNILDNTGNFLARYCTGESVPIAECQLGGTGETVSIHRCVAPSIGAGSWDEADYKTVEEADYGWNYGEDYIKHVLVDVSTLPVTNITQSNFVANGSIDSIGEDITVVKRGFCYKVKE